MFYIDNRGFNCSIYFVNISVEQKNTIWKAQDDSTEEHLMLCKSPWFIFLNHNNLLSIINVIRLIHIKTGQLTPTKESISISRMWLISLKALLCIHSMNLFLMIECCANVTRRFISEDLFLKKPSSIMIFLW